MAGTLIYQVSAVSWAFLFSVAACIISVFSLIYFKSYLKRRTSQERILSELREEVNKILKTIDETTDRDISLIEEREKTLKSLLDDIEKRLKVYIREMDKRPVVEETRVSPPGAGKATVSNSTEPGSGSLSAGSDKLYVDLGKLRYRLKNLETAEPAPSAADPKPSPEHVTGPQGEASGIKKAVQIQASPPTLNEQIYSLVKQGLSVQEIAGRLKLSIAHVEFRVALLEKRE